MLLGVLLASAGASAKPPQGEGGGEAKPVTGGIGAEVPDVPQEVPEAEAYEGKTVVAVKTKLVAALWTKTPTIGAPKVGEKFLFAPAHAELKRLLASGAFATGSLQIHEVASGVEVIFRLVPSRRVRRVLFHGNVLVEDELRHQAQLSDVRDVTEAKLDEATRLVRAYYGKRGYRKARVEIGTIETDDPLTVVVDVRIEPGEPTTISGRVFDGFPRWDAQAAAAEGKYSVLTGDRADDEALEAADRSLANALRAVGFHGAIVTHELFPTPSAEGRVEVWIKIVPGSKIVPAFDGNEVFDRGTLLELLDLPNEADRSPLRLAGKIEDAYKRRGYLDAKVTPELLGQPIDGRRTLLLHVREGAIVSVTGRMYPCLRGALGKKRLDEEIDSFIEEELEGGGSSALDTGALDETIVGGEVARGARPHPVTITSRATYVPEAYERAVEHLRELFRSEGYIFSEIADPMVLRATCSPKSKPGQCVSVEPTLPEADKLCQSDLEGLPKPSPPIPRASTCTPDPVKGIQCAPTVKVVIPINPGPRSYLWDLSFDGAKSIAPAVLGGSSVAGAELRFGEPLSLKDVEAARRRVLDHYRDEGYAFATVRATVEYSPDKSRARVRIQVSEGEQVVVDKIFVDGNRRTLESLIRARLVITEGGVYRAKSARLSQDRLGQLGVFSSVSIGLVNPTIPGKRKNVQVSVVERPPQALDLRAGVSTGEGFRGYLEYSYANFFGYAVSWVGRAKLAYQPFLLPPEFYDPVVVARWERLRGLQRVPRRLSGTITLPHSPIFGATVRTTLEAVNILDLRRDFTLNRTSPILSLTWNPVKWFTAILAGDLEYNEFQLFEKDPLNAYILRNPALAGLLRVPDGTTGVSATRATLTVDFRDNPLGATKNGYVSVTPEWVRTILKGAQSRQDFLHVTAGVGTYFKIGWLPKKPVLALELKAGGNFNVFSCYGDPTHVEEHYTTSASGGVGPRDPVTGLPIGPRAPSPVLTRTQVPDCDTYPDRLFYLGGSDSFRGMYPGEMLPQDSIDEINAALQSPDPNQVLDPAIRAQAPRGGNVYVNPRVELRVPAFRWGGFVLFLDAANSWRDKTKMRPWVLRYALGAGLSIDTPVGPIGLDLGWNLRPYTQFDERLWAFNFSIGRF